MEQVKHKVNEVIEKMTEKGIHPEDIDMLGKLVDIHKDISNEEYWKIKEEVMRYSNYGRMNYDDTSYGRRRRDSRGRYMEQSRGRYRGNDMLDEMNDNYTRYHESREEGRRGNYGAKEDSMKSLEYMLQSAYDFMCMLSDEADSQEEVELVQKYARKISEL